MKPRTLLVAALIAAAAAPAWANSCKTSACPRGLETAIPTYPTTEATKKEDEAWRREENITMQDLQNRMSVYPVAQPEQATNEANSSVAKREYENGADKINEGYKDCIRRANDTVNQCTEGRTACAMAGHQLAKDCLSEARTELRQIQ